MGRNGRVVWITNSPEETLSIGRSLAKELEKPSILALFGDLGAGKTTLIKGIVEGLTGICPSEVTSPTFVTMNLYVGPASTAYHFDLYRLSGAEDFLAMGFEEYLLKDGVSLIEWSERIASLLPKNTPRVEIVSLGEEKRKITLSLDGF